MASIPEYGAPRVGREVMPSPNLGRQLPDPYAGTFQAAGQVAQEVGRQQQEELDGILQVAANDASLQMAAEEQRLRTHLKSVKGLSALDASRKAVEDYDKFYSEHEGRITNPLVKRHARDRFMRHRQALSDFGEAYSSGEVLEHDNRQSKAMREMYALNAIADPDDIYEQDLAIDVLTNEPRRFAKRNGLPPEEAEVEVKRGVSALRLGVLNAFLTQNRTKAAQEYYKLHKGELAGDDIQRAANLMEQQTSLQEARRYADLAGKAKTSGEALEVFKGIEDEAIRQKATALWRNDKALAEAAAQEDYAKSYNDAVKTIYGSVRGTATAPDGSPLMIQRPRNAQEALGVAVYNSFNAKEQGSLDKLFKYSRGLEVPQTDDMFNLRALAIPLPELAQMTPEQFIMNFRPHMADKEFDALKERWKDARDKDPGKAQGLYKMDDLVMAGLRRTKLAGITDEDTLDSIKSKPAKAAAYNVFRDMVNQDMIDATQGGKRLGPEEEESLINRAVFKMNRKYVGSQDLGPDSRPLSYFELVSDPSHGIMTSRYLAPQSDRSRYFNALRSSGAVPLGKDERDYIRENRERFNRAYLAEQNNAPLSRVLEILKGTR